MKQSIFLLSLGMKGRLTLDNELPSNEGIVDQITIIDMSIMLFLHIG